MPKVMKICKACGKEYEACHTPSYGAFRWRDVACSIECAEKYIHDVQVARGEIVEEQPAPKPEVVDEPMVVANDTADVGSVVNTDPIEEPEVSTVYSRRNRFRKK